MSCTSGQRPDRWGEVYLSTIARAVSNCGDFLATTALVLALQGRGAGGFAVGALLVAAAAPPTLLAPLTGRLVDRVDSRVLLVAVSLVETAVCTGLAFVSGTVPIILLVAVLACGLAITSPTFNALLAEMVGRDSLPKASAIGQSAASIGMLIAPALGGLLVGQFGLRVPLLIDAGSYLAVTVAALLIRTRRGAPVAATGAATGAATPPVSWALRRDPLMRSVTIMVAAVVAAVSAVNVADVFFIRGTLHGSTTTYGVVGAVWTAAMLAGAWRVASRPLSDGGLSVALLVSLGGACLAVVLASTVPAVGWMVPLWVLGGASNGGVNVASGVLLARRVPAAVRGRASAVFGAVASGANGTGFLLGGLVLSVVSARMLLALAGGVGLAVALAFAVPMRRAAPTAVPAPAPVPAS